MDASVEAPPIQYSFYFEMKPLRKLRLAIEAMADQEFSECGVGRVDVDGEGFEISVKNSRNNVAHLWVDAVDMVEFRFFELVIGKFVCLGEISYGFPAGLEGDDDVVRVFHVLGSDELCLEFMTDPLTEFSAKLLGTNPAIERFSPVTVVCMTDVSTTTLKEMIEYTSKAEDPSTRQFLVEVRDNYARFKLQSHEWKNDKVGATMKTLSKFFEGVEAEGSTGLVAGQKFQSGFNLTYIALLKKASLIEPDFDVCFLSAPEEHVVFRFRIERRSHLAIVKEILSAENPETNYSFYLEMRPLHKLRLAIEAMADREFNHDGFAMVEADTKDFGFVVQNDSNDFAYLWLDTSSLVSFRCYGRLFARLVPLRFICQRLPPHLRGYQDTVCIFHVLGTNRMFFKTGTRPQNEFSVELNSISPEAWFPRATVICMTNVPTEGMKQMIDSMFQAKDPSTTRVRFTMKKNIATFEIGNMEKWQYKDRRHELSGTTGSKPRKIYKAEFNWSYTKFLKKASSLDIDVDLNFMSLPEEHIMFQFSIGGKGFLVIMKRNIFRGP